MERRGEVVLGDGGGGRFEGCAEEDAFVGLGGEEVAGFVLAGLDLWG